MICSFSPHSKILNYSETEFREVKSVLKGLSGETERPKVCNTPHESKETVIFTIIYIIIRLKRK